MALPYKGQFAASVLLMALGPDCPPFKITEFKSAYKRTLHPMHPDDADEGEAYDHGLHFLDELVACRALPDSNGHLAS